MCQHYFRYTPQGSKYSIGTCAYCGVSNIGLNGFPDDAYEHGMTFNIKSNPLRQPENNIERILNDRRFPHIFQRTYLDNIQYK